jgi:hypothetical protein
LTIVVYILVLVQAFRDPPLVKGPVLVGKGSYSGAVGLELINDSSLPVYLTDVYVEGAHLRESVAIRSLWTENRVVSAANLALEPDLHPHVTGPIKGWRINRGIGKPHDSYGLRLVWEPEATLNPVIHVRYRYLGFPMELQIHVEVPKLGE